MCATALQSRAAVAQGLVVGGRAMRCPAITEAGRSSSPPSATAETVASKAMRVQVIRRSE